MARCRQHWFFGFRLIPCLLATCFCCLWQCLFSEEAVYTSINKCPWVMPITNTFVSPENELFDCQADDLFNLDAIHIISQNPHAASKQFSSIYKPPWWQGVPSYLSLALTLNSSAYLTTSLVSKSRSHGSPPSLRRDLRSSSLLLC